MYIGRSIPYICLAAMALFLFPACGESAAEGDGENASFSQAGKADTMYGDCMVGQVLAYANDPYVTAETMKSDGINSRAANNIEEYRAGADDTLGTDDDLVVDSMDALDAISWVGPVTMGQLVTATAHRCEAQPHVEVIFSPQPYEHSHLVKVQELISGAEATLDIAMYSFSDHGIMAELEKAVARGVRVRFIFEKANEDRKEPEGSKSAKLESLGIDVRYINKIMHHKYMLVDGPRDSIDAAYTGTLVTGSGNWSNSAGTVYDENTAVVTGAGELLLRFQQEFNHLWRNSRDFLFDYEFPWELSRVIPDVVIVDDPHVDVVFTSDNFEVKMSNTYGPTFSVQSGRSTASDKLVELIDSATESIHVASGHLRSRPVALALMAKAQANPEMDIRVLLDNQEYISSWYNGVQIQSLEQCVLDAGDSESKVQKCHDKGFYYSYPLHEAGVPLRFKYYCYRWHYKLALQMHHKYMVFDGRLVASGSYNLSDNAEHNTMENIAMYDAASHPDMVAAFEGNFEKLWTMGEADSLYEKLLMDIESGQNAVPLVFTPMGLTWSEVSVLKKAIRDNCPYIDDFDFKKNPHKHKVCLP
jgi:phosphatidylserine/phosphatidylglycerophosphate/cardiolipin synthase-like enzyme